MINVYDFELSGNCYKVRLFLHILGLEHKLTHVDFFPGFEHKSDAFLRLNPLGQLPVLQDGDTVYRDAQAILVYLAAKYDKSGQWYPAHNPDLLGQVQMWLAFAEGLTGSISAARLHHLFQFDFDTEACQERAHQQLRVLDDHLWLREKAGGRFICDADYPTIADIACFPYVVLADEGGVSLMNYPAVRRWTDAVKRIPGFIVMAGVFPVSDELPEVAAQTEAVLEHG